MSKKRVEKYIEERLKKINGVEKFYIEKSKGDSIDVIVVSSKIDNTSSSSILDLETKINRDFKIPSNFKIYPVESW